MIDQKIRKECTGCTACKNVCPKQAITMEADEEGFLYPKVQEEACVDCGLCIKKCPILQSTKSDKYIKPEVYAAWNTDINIRVNSTSGGVFSALAKAVILQKGVVVGASYDKDFFVYHTIIDKIEDIEHLRQSKYAQSNLDDIFRQIKELVLNKRLVLFCGTPCQAAGLQTYLGRPYQNIFYCDFICRGVISPKVYKKFLDDMCKKADVVLKRVHFKNKDYGWNRFSTKLSFEDKTSYQKDRDEDYYMRGYLKHNLYLRPSCHECKFKEFPRKADISLGDFWGIGNFKKELDNDMGTSVVLINSEKGKQLLEWAKSELYLEQRQLEEVLAGNSCLLKSAECGQYREYFFKNMHRYSFDELIKKIDQMAQNLSFKDKVLQNLYLLKQWALGKRDE